VLGQVWEMEELQDLKVSPSLPPSLSGNDKTKDVWVWVKPDGTPSDMYQGGWKVHEYDWVEHEVRERVLY